MYNSNDVAGKIKLLAKVRKVSVRKMLNDIGLGFNTMSNMKTSMPKADNLAKIADYLDCSVDYLLGRDGKSDTSTFNVLTTNTKERENAKLQKLAVTFEKLNEEAQNSLLDYLNFMVSQPKNLKKENDSFQMNA